MKMKIVASLAIAAFLTGCGGANDHPKELLGVWSTECSYGGIDTYTFDNELTLMHESHSDSDCITKSEKLELKTDALYDPELKITSSGAEALKVQITVTDVVITPFSSSSIRSNQRLCPSLDWVVGQEISVFECLQEKDPGAIAQDSILLYLNNNNLYIGTNYEPRDADGFPSDINYETPYIKQ